MCACLCICVHMRTCVHVYMCVCASAYVFVHTSNYNGEETTVHFEHSISQTNYTTMLSTKIPCHNEFPHYKGLPIWSAHIITNRIAIATHIVPYSGSHMHYSIINIMHLPYHTIPSILQRHPQILYTHERMQIAAKICKICLIGCK